MTKRTSMRLAATVLMAVAAAGCGASSGKDAADPAADAALLAARDVAVVARADLATGVLVQGTLEPALDVSITAPYPEAIDEVLVKEGQAVRRGQVLARFRASSLTPAAASAEATRRIAASDYERMQNLFREGAVSQRDVDAAETQLRSAEALAAAAQKRLDEATVTAPIAGVIAERVVQSGDRVGDGDPMFRLVNTDELEFAASVPTEALGSVRPGAAVTLAVSGLGGAGVAGRVSRVNATVDQATRQVKVYVAVPNRDHRLAGDMFASGRIVLAEARNVVALSTAAMQSAPDGKTYAWIVAGGKLEKRAVTLGLHDELRDMVEVKNGLQGGETVIVSPMEGLAAGQAVQIGGEGAPAKAPPAKAVPTKAAPAKAAPARRATGEEK